MDLCAAAVGARMLPLQGYGFKSGCHFRTFSLKGARVAPAGPPLGVVPRGVFWPRRGAGAKKVFGAPAAATAQIHRGFGVPSGRGRKKSWGKHLAGTGERPIFALAFDRDGGLGGGGRSGGSLRQCSEKKEEQKVDRSVAGAKDTKGRRAGAGRQFLQWRV